MPGDEKQRIEALRRYAILDTAPELRFDRITSLAARLFDVPMAVVSLVDEHRQWFKSRVGVERHQTARDISFCTHAIRGDQVMVVPDAVQDPRFASSPLVTGEPGIRFYAGAPLITSDGFRLGTLCVQDRLPRDSFAPADAANLADLAALVVDELEFRLAEHQRSEVGRLFASVFETAPVGIAILDEAGLYLHVNPAYCRLYGYQPAELLGRGFWMMLPEEEEQQARRDHSAFLSGQGELPETRRVRTRQGSLLDVFVNYSLLVTGDGRRLRVTAVTDVTRIRQAEAALRESHQRLSQLAAIIESSNDAIIGTSPDGIITSWNASAERIFGYSAAEMLGARFDAIVPDDMREESKSLDSRIALGEPVVSYETTRLRKDGARIHISLTVSPVKDAQGNVIGRAGIVRDVTARKRLEEQLIHSQKMEAVALLAGGVAHDFNNLLTIIIGYARMLILETAPASEFREYADEILYSAERASSLTSQLLAFSRRQVSKPRVLDLNEVVESMNKLLGRILGEHISLRTVPGADLGRVKADPGQIEQVIANLAVNARDAMPRGGRLTIETANVELDREYVRKHPQVPSGSYVMLAVTDTGIGIPHDILQHIFEPFFTTKEKGKGTGLGLSIIHGIVKQNGGEIWVYTEPGQGTTFKIYLPRVQEPAEPWRTAQSRSALPHGSETVLVVEDEAAVAKMLREILSRLGYTVLEAADGQKALELCGAHAKAIHILLTDVVMPGMAGPDLARAVRILRPETRIIFMSGYTDNSVLHQELLDPDAEFLQKPFTPEEVAQRIRSVLDRRP
jgi:two-component system cell cycle sensor histidine kinase/response regulator CckA